MEFCGQLVSRSHGLEELWAVWRAQSSHGTTAVTVALLQTFHSLLSIDVTSVAGHGPVAAALNNLANSLLTTELAPLYRFCSSGDHAKGNYALHLLAKAASYSPSHTMQFLSNFNFSFNMLHKLAAPARRKGPAPTSGQKSSPSTPTSAHSTSSATWDDPDLSKRPSRALFVRLAVAVVGSAPPGAGVAKALRAPQLLPLVMHNLSKDPPQSVIDVCSVILSRVLSPGPCTLAPSAVPRTAPPSCSLVHPPLSQSSQGSRIAMACCGATRVHLVQQRAYGFC